MLIATLLITLGAMGRRWCAGRVSRQDAATRPAREIPRRGVPVAVPIAFASLGGLTATVAVVCC
ncbi:hypothetical protein ABZV91_11775 [Nocardia sp. NPDC004568]|uniref:hypothetical protein n=1 Tax=Nocardia sp. NPDC004568 TaxID=3154551 RepID=UPI0033BF4330